VARTTLAVLLVFSCSGVLEAAEAAVAASRGNRIGPMRVRGQRTRTIDNNGYYNDDGISAFNDMSDQQIRQHNNLRDLKKGGSKSKHKKKSKSSSSKGMSKQNGAPSAYPGKGKGQQPGGPVGKGTIIISPGEDGTTTITFPDGTVVTPGRDDGRYGMNNIDGAVGDMMVDAQRQSVNVVYSSSANEEEEEEEETSTSSTTVVAENTGSGIDSITTILGDASVTRSNLFNHAKSITTKQFSDLPPKMVRQSAGQCELNANGFYGAPQGEPYEVTYAYQVVVQDGVTQAAVETQIAPWLDTNIAQGLLPFFFDCSTRRRHRRNLQAAVQPTISGISRLQTDFPIVNGGELCYSRVLDENLIISAVMSMPLSILTPTSHILSFAM